MRNKELITIIIVSYKSDKNLLNNILLKLAPIFKIIIIENSQDESVKIFEKKYSNVLVHISEKNNGNGAGINIGLKMSNTKYSIYMDSDVEISVDNFFKLIDEAEKIEDFIMLVPNINSKFKKKEIEKCYDFTGCVMFFNMREIDKVGFFDENFFLYFEELDFAYKCKKLKKNIFLIPSVNLLHVGQSSVKANGEKVKYLREWHFMWSKFYFYKKNFSFFIALIKTFKDLIINIVKFIIFFLINRKKAQVYFARIEGLFFSIIGKKSFKRLII